MGNDLENITKTSLGEEKGQTPTTIKLLAMELDRKFESLEEKAKERHEEVLNAISDLNTKTNQKFDKLKVVMFFSENPKLLIATLIGLVVIGFITYL